MRLILLAAFLALATPPAPASTEAPPFLLGPICSHDETAPIAGPHRLVMLTGMGNDHMAADTANPQAERWFDYGLQLARAFEHKDAIAAFQKAEQLDPACALCVWAEAWARGPTINYLIKADETKAAEKLAVRAAAMAGPRASPRVNALTAALVVRYRAFEPNGDAERAYARALDDLRRLSPGDVELALFDADAWMIVDEYGDKSGLKHAVEILRPLIAAHPDHSGLIHFYIHATEKAGEPELAAPYADRLGVLAPAASHLVHMPSHTYYRVGRYEDAAQANLRALNADRAYAEKTDYPTPLGTKMYHAHDLQFGIGAALMSGDGPLALELADQFNRDFPAPATFSAMTEMAAAQTYMAYGRFASPQRVLALPDPGLSRTLLEAMRHYARGEAFARLGRHGDVRAEAARITPGPAMRGSALAEVQIARLVLEGRADMLGRNPVGAVPIFRQAAEIQEAKLAGSGDPPLWWYPVRRDLASALLAAGDARGAEREAETTLKAWKADPVTLLMLARARGALGEPKAGDTLRAAEKAWRGDPGQLRAG